MKFETKLIRNNSSIRTTVPKALINLLDLSEKDKLQWDVDITEKEAVITLTPKKSKK